MGVDLHTHTTASDGCLEPADLVKAGITLGLDGLAITDHDTMAGLARARSALTDPSFLLVPGLELSCQWQDRELHILGYWPKEDCPELQETLFTLQQARQKRIHQMVEKLLALGFTITEERVQELAGNGSVGRPHIAMALMEKGYALSIQDAFQKYLNPKGVAYVPRFKMLPSEGVALISRAGGVAVFAHPVTAAADILIPELKQAGLRGIEVSHPRHDITVEQHYRDLAGKYGLVATGGSDFHQEGLGSHTCSLAVLEQLAKYRKG